MKLKNWISGQWNLWLIERIESLMFIQDVSVPTEIRSISYQARFQKHLLTLIAEPQEPIWSKTLPFNDVFITKPIISLGVYLLYTSVSVFIYSLHSLLTCLYVITPIYAPQVNNWQNSPYKYFIFLFYYFFPLKTDFCAR